MYLGSIGLSGSRPFASLYFLHLSFDASLLLFLSSSLTFGFEDHLLLPKAAENGFRYTNKTRTIPCPPDWVTNLQDNGILLLDDYSRSNSLFSQAVMELVNEGTMIGWDLKEKKVQILLSENPDNGEYNVASQDGAQTDRMAKINMVWDAQDWAERAEKVG